MKGRVIVLEDVRGDAEISAAALVVDGRVEDLLIDPPAADPTPPVGSVHQARVDRSAGKTGGVFVALGQGRTGFLRGGHGLAPGAELRVQVTGDAEAGKAVPVTDRVLYKGRAVILTPGAPGINISRRIRETEERERLATVIAEWAEALEGAGPNWGWIARSAAAGADPRSLAAEMRWLAAAAGGSPDASGPIFSRDAAATALCEWTDPLPGSIIAADAAMERLRALVARRLGDADLLARCEAFGKGSPFDHFGVREAIEALGRAEAPLPSGGSLVVEPTRALVAVDVNTRERFSGGAALTANLEAARELPRQLRLRGLGGQVAVDFAPVPKKDRRRVEDALKTAFRRDPVETSLAGWTPLGHFELSRKRERRPLGPHDI